MTYLTPGRRRRRPPSSLGVALLLGLSMWVAAGYGIYELARWLL